MCTAGTPGNLVARIVPLLRGMSRPGGFAAFIDGSRHAIIRRSRLRTADPVHSSPCCGEQVVLGAMERFEWQQRLTSGCRKADGTASSDGSARQLNAS